MSPNGAITIKEATKTAIAILKSDKIKALDIKQNDSPSLISIDRFLTKLNGAIDSNWKSLPVSANVIPPSGTPNAAAGMNPDAIADPLLKKKYLELIKKNQDNNLKNGQQRALRDSREKFLKAISELVAKTPGEGWNKNDVVARFCKDKESIEILERNLKQREK